LKRDDWSAALFLMAALIAGGESCRAEGTLSSLLACRDVADAGARLACFDRESAAMASPGAAVAATAPAAAAPAAAAPAAAAPAAAAAAAAVTPPGPVLDPKQQFGLPEREVARQQVAAGARAPDVAKVQARVVGLALTGDGRTVVSLDNDQVWRQLAADADLFLKLGDTVTISRAFLGSFWLATPTKRGSKVTRVR
jgi:hypothetical protein